MPRPLHACCWQLRTWHEAVIGHLSTPAEEYLTWLEVDQGRARNTIIAYRRDLLAYEEFLGGRDIPIPAATVEDIEQYLLSRRTSGLSRSSVVRELAAIRGFYHFCVDEGLIGSDPSERVAPWKPLDALPKAITEEQVAGLIAAVRGGGPVPRRDRAVLEVLYATGVRVSELVGLSLGDFTNDRHMARVLGKGGRERLVPLGRCALDALDQWLSPEGRELMVPPRWARRDDSEAVFLNSRGGRLTRQGAWGVVRRYAVATGLADRVHPHVLRHSCATHMLAHGADIRVVQELLGHSTIATTQRYTKVTPEHLRRAYEQAHPRARKPAASADSAAVDVAPAAPTGPAAAGGALGSPAPAHLAPH